jgi:hypothetical protein
VIFIHIYCSHVQVVEDRLPQDEALPPHNPEAPERPRGDAGEPVFARVLPHRGGNTSVLHSVLPHRGGNTSAKMVDRCCVSAVSIQH